jgi:hypothetical protein
MATIATYASRSAAFAGRIAAQTTNGTAISPTLQYTSDGVAIAVEFEGYLSSPYYDRVTLHISSEGAPKTTVKNVSYTVTNTTGNPSFSDYTVGGNNGTVFAAFILNTNEDVVVPLIGTGQNGTTQGAIYFVKFTKPTQGWRAWATDATATTLSSSITTGVSTLGINGASAYSYGLKGAWHTASGHIVVLTYFNSSPSTSVFGYLVFNSTTLAYVSFTGFGSTTTTGASVVSGAQFGRNSQGGVIWYNQGTAATTDLVKTNIWNVSSSGVLTATDRGKLFGITLDSYSTSMQYVQRINSVYYGNNKLVSIARPAAGSQFYLRVDQISQTSTSISSLQSDSTYASTPSGSYSSGGASTISTVLQPFYEEGFVRIWSFDGSANFGYLDAFINTTTNAITWASTSVSVGSWSITAGAGYSQFAVPTFNRYQDHIAPAGASITSYFDNTVVTLPTGATWSNATTGPSAASFISPTVSSLNLQGGLKLQVTYTGTIGGHASDWYGRNPHQAAPFGYQLKRTLSGTDTYYDAGTQTFSTSVVTNTSTASAVSIDIPASAGFATSGTYTFSVAIVDANGSATPFGTTDSITSTTSAATTTPTATRFIRKTLANVTLSHEYTFNNKALINKINIANAGSGTSTIAVQVGGIYLVAPVSLPAGSTLTVDTSQVADANDRLMLTSSNTATDIYISGTEGI